MEELTFSCPVCHADVSRHAKSCPQCGACEKSGWSEDQYLDGLGLPDDPDDRLTPPPEAWKYSWVIIVVVILAFFIFAMWRRG